MRNRSEEGYENDDILKSRLIHMPELHVELYLSTWIEAISDHIKDNARKPIYIGNSYISLNYYS